MTVLASTHPDVMRARELVAEGCRPSLELVTILLDHFDEQVSQLQAELAAAPSQGYTDSLESDLDDATRLAEKRLEALREAKANIKATLNVIDELGGV